MQESSVAVVLPQKPAERGETVRLITPTDEQVEVIKVRQLLFGLRCVRVHFTARVHLCYLSPVQVFLESRSERETSVRMLTDEVSQIQEVSVCQTATHHATFQATHTHCI